MLLAAWLWTPSVLAGAVVVALGAHAAVFALAARVVKLTPNVFDKSIFHRGGRPCD
jgi:hypothetical protein